MRSCLLVRTAKGALRTALEDISSRDKVETAFPVFGGVDIAVIVDVSDAAELRSVAQTIKEETHGVELVESLAGTEA